MLPPMTERDATRSPIKNLPVRFPGQSIQSRIIEVVFDGLLVWVTLAVMVVFAALQLWIQYWRSTVWLPATMTVAGIVTVALAAWKWRIAARELKALHLGRTGEEAVGQYLDECLRPKGFQVLHDIPGDRFNLDHVLIGTTGVYCIETKTHSKPQKGAPQVRYDGSAITVNGFTPDRDPLIQVKAGAHWLAELLEASTGQRFKVQPVVLYPGWFVDSSVQWPEIWVLNEKQLPSTVARQKPVISDADVHLATYHLKRYVIAKTKELTGA